MENHIDFVGNIGDFSLYHADVIDSTNTHLKAHYASFPNLAVLEADYQTAAYGRYKRAWVNDGDLCFSIVAKEDNRYEIISALAVMRALRFYSLPAFIKWPNDIYADNEKICGILVEDIYSSQRFEASIIGIGIDMTPKKEVECAFVRRYSSVDKRTLLIKVLEEFQALKNADFSDILEEYAKNNLIINRHIDFKGENLLVTSFTKEGYLVCLDEENKEKIIKSDEINIKESLRQ